jgi:hypothetical protein
MSSGTTGAASAAPYPIHDLAKIFPPLSEGERQKLKDDISAQGLLESITLYKGKVLDGANRQDICVELGVTPTYIQYVGSTPASFVIGKNLHRRHLTISQRAAIGAELLPYFEREAKRRKTGRPPKVSANRHTLSEVPSRRAATDAAKAVGASTRSVSRAKRVKDNDPETFEQVKNGDVSVDTAEQKVRHGVTKDKSASKAPAKRRGQKGWDGKSTGQRGRELHDRKRTGDYNDLLAVQIRLNRMCGQLEAIDISEYRLDEATLALVADLHDDLISLTEWLDRTLSGVQAWLSDVAVRAKIEKLRDTTGRTEPEAETARKLAARLERKLLNRLAA